MKRIAVSLALIALASAAASAGVVFSEDFGTLANGTQLTSSNTDFDYLRVGTGGGSYTALNPSTVGSGASMALVGSTSTSLAGVGLSTGLGVGTTMSMTFSYKPSATTGDLFLGMGTGSTFTGNGTFASTDLLWAIQSDAGNLEYRADGWNNASYTLSANTQYDFEIIVDGGSMDLSINGSLVLDGVNVQGSQNGDGFRFYGISGSDTHEIDNIVIYDSVIPEPATMSLLAVGGLVALARRRK